MLTFNRSTTATSSVNQSQASHFSALIAISAALAALVFKDSTYICKARFFSPIQ
jgi:hypothetical protein